MLTIASTRTLPNRRNFRVRCIFGVVYFLHVKFIKRQRRLCERTLEPKLPCTKLRNDCKESWIDCTEKLLKSVEVLCKLIRPFPNRSDSPAAEFKLGGFGSWKNRRWVRKRRGDKGQFSARKDFLKNTTHYSFESKTPCFRERKAVLAVERKVQKKQLILLGQSGMFISESALGCGNPEKKSAGGKV